MTTEEQKQALIHKSFVLMFRILLIFGIPAALAYFVGKWVDEAFNIRPFGSLAALAVSFIFSWVLVIHMYKKMNAAFAEIEKKESEEQAMRQEEIQKKLNQ